MTESEARLYFPFTNEDDLDEIFEEKLFEQKQFFLQRMPVSKVIASRLDKIQKIENAFRYFGGEVEPFQPKEIQFQPYVSDNIKEVFSLHELNKNTIKLQLNRARSVEEMRFSLNRWIEITRTFAEKWKLNVINADANVKVSNEPDAMALLDEITKFEQLGFSTFDDLQHLLTDSPLMLEANRLSLWLKLENDV